MAENTNYYYPETMVGAPMPPVPITVNGVTLTPVPGLPGVYRTPWGQQGYVTPKTDAFGDPIPGSQDFTAIPDRYFDGSAGGSNQRMAGDDPRYWQLQYDQLAQQYMNSGLDAESARQQALTTLIANRNNTALGVANTSADIAKTAAQFAANPRDAVAELIYRNQTGGSTPFGDMTSKNFGEYGKALAAKAESIFSPVQKDLGLARDYARSIPPTEFFGPETRAQLNLAPTAAQRLTGVSPSAAAAAPSGANTDVQGALQWVNRFGSSAQPTAEGERFRQYVTGGQYKPPGSFAGGGELDFSGIFANRDKPGFSPSSSEGGTNLNIHERAVIVGESGKVYGTLGEKRSDGTVRSEQLIIKPLKSEVEKDKRLADGQKAIVESQKKTLASFAIGGGVNATPDDFMAQLSKLLGSYGGAGGGTGSYDTPLPSLRMLAGAPANALVEDPVAQDYALAGYSALGIDPRTVASTIRKFTPTGIVNNSPRVAFA